MTPSLFCCEFAHVVLHVAGAAPQASVLWGKDDHQWSGDLPGPVLPLSMCTMAILQERPAILFIDTACLPQAVEQLKDVLAYPTDPASLSNLLWAVKQDPPAARDAAAGAHSKKAGPLAWGEPP